MDSPSPPQAPDPYVVANAQAGANTDAARVTTSLNRADQYTPYGSQTWSQGASTRKFNQDRYDKAVAAARAAAPVASAPGLWGVGGYRGDGEGNLGLYGWGMTAPTATSSPVALPDRNDAQFYDETPSDRWASYINLDPRVQAVLDAQLATSQGLSGVTNSALERVNEAFSKPAPTADAATRQRAEEALYSRYTSRLDPKFQQEEQALRSQLMNRGLVEGSEAWKTQMDAFGRGRNDAYSQARDNSIIGGGQEMSRQYELESAARNAILNELSGLRTGQQVATPQFSGTPSGANVNAAPIAQAMQNSYQGQLGMYNSDVASNNSTMGAVGSVAAAAMMAF